MDRTVEDARDFLNEKTGVEPKFIEARGKGFFFQIDKLDRSAMDVFGDSSQYLEDIDYCLLETTNEDGTGYYQETMRYKLAPGEESGFHAEVHYRRPLNGDNHGTRMDAEVEGMVWITTAADHEDLGRECDDSFYLRTVEHTIYEINNLGNLLSTVRYQGARATAASRKDGIKRLANAVSSLNRTIIRS